MIQICVPFVIAQIGFDWLRLGGDIMGGDKSFMLPQISKFFSSKNLFIFQSLLDLHRLYSNIFSPLHSNTDRVGSSLPCFNNQFIKLFTAAPICPMKTTQTLCVDRSPLTKWILPQRKVGRRLTDQHFWSANRSFASER